MKSNPRGFSLVELLVVIGVIAVLIGILMPTLNKARASARSAVCLSNLRVLGQATQMYINEKKGYMPYPTTTFGEPSLWYNALDPYLAGKADETRTGVARGRTYTPFKQCVVFGSFDGNRINDYQDTTKEYSRTYKWNSNLRRNNPYKPAKITDVREPTKFVLVGDGVSMDQVGPYPSQWDNGQFSMEVNDTANGASPALRHNGGANIGFVDGHAENVRLKSFARKLVHAPYPFIQAWEGEYLSAAGTPIAPNTLWGAAPDPKRNWSMEQHGLSRNPNMPLRWSLLGKLYR